MSVWRQLWQFVPGWVLVTLLAVVSVTFAAPAVPPSPTSHVTDDAGVLSSSTLESLGRRLARYEQESGHQVIVYVSQSSGAVPIEDFAVEAFEQWKIGRPKLDDGLGIFVFVEDRAIRVEVGYGLEPTITDLIASRVIRTIMIPRIQQRDWDGAIVSGVEALVDTIEGAPGSLPADAEAATAERRKFSGLQILALIGGFVLFMILMVTNPGLALGMLFMIGRGGGGDRGNGGFGGLGGGSGGGGATGRW
jgi:uncharacterized protein